MRIGAGCVRQARCGEKRERGGSGRERQQQAGGGSTRLVHAAPRLRPAAVRAVGAVGQAAPQHRQQLALVLGAAPARSRELRQLLAVGAPRLRVRRVVRKNLRNGRGRRGARRAGGECREGAAAREKTRRARAGARTSTGDSPALASLSARPRRRKFIAQQVLKLLLRLRRGEGKRRAHAWLQRGPPDASRRAAHGTAGSAVGLCLQYQGCALARNPDLGVEYVTDR